MNKAFYSFFSLLLYANFCQSALSGVPGEVIAVGGHGAISKLDQRFLEINFKDQNYILFAIPYSASNESKQFDGIDINIIKKDFGESRITIEDLSKVDLSKEDADRAYKEAMQIRNAVNSYSTDFKPNMDFSSPIPDGIISSRYGKKRFINNTPRSPHLSLDIAASEGTPIQAPSKGKVILTGNFFYSGNYLIIDHGYGLISSYSHMSEIYLEAGDYVEKDQSIGAVGSSGRVTGPHLHWTVYLNKIRINPESLLKKDYLQGILQSYKDVI